MFDQSGAEVLDKSFPRPQRECAAELREIQRLSGAQHLGPVLHQLVHTFPQRLCTWRGHQSSPGTHQQRITRGFPQACQGTAHGRRAEVQFGGSARHAAFLQQDVQRVQQIEIGSGHAMTLAQTGKHGVERNDSFHMQRLPPCQ